MKDNIQTLISKDKLQFICLWERNGIPKVISFFQAIAGEIQPCLSLDINRIIRTQKLLRGLPSVFIMHSDGRQIDIDAISKIVSFGVQDIKGVIQYQIDNKETLDHTLQAVYEAIDEKYHYVVMPIDKTEFQLETLKVFPLMLQQGCIVCVADAVEKYLHCPLHDTKTGFIGITDQEDTSRIDTFQNIWPELGLRFIIEDNKLHIYSDLLAEEFKDREGEYFVRIHRNFGGSDVQVQLTHQLLPDYSKQVGNVKYGTSQDPTEDFSQEDKSA